MTINRLLVAGNIRPEQRCEVEIAFKYTLRKLGLVDRNDPVCELVARKVIELRESGVSDALAIGEIAYRQLAP
jgi:hypothetical protein